MERRQLGKTEMWVTVLGYGGAEIGYQDVAADKVSDLLNKALDAGLNVIDTAECYGNSEEMIGKAVGHRRSDYYLFTKCGHYNGSAAADWSAASLLASIQRSLKRLNTPHVDLIQLHSCSESELRKGEVISALKEAKEKGYSRYIGYSGDRGAALFAIQCGEFDTLQTSLSIADQEAIDLTIPAAREKQMGVIAKRPIANAAWRDKQPPESAYHYEYWRRLGILDYPFLHGNGDAAGIALRFTLSIPGVHTEIVGTTRPERWADNARVVEKGPLDEKQMHEIRERWKAVAADNWTGQT